MQERLGVGGWGVLGGGSGGTAPPRPVAVPRGVGHRADFTVCSVREHDQRLPKYCILCHTCGIAPTFSCSKLMNLNHKVFF